MFYFECGIAMLDLLNPEDKRLLESLASDLQTLRAATNDFHIDNKIEQGGFDTVYKVCKFNVAAVLIHSSIYSILLKNACLQIIQETFPNSQLVVVKRLSQNSN